MANVKASEQKILDEIAKDNDSYYFSSTLAIKLIDYLSESELKNNLITKGFAIACDKDNLLKKMEKIIISTDDIIYLNLPKIAKTSSIKLDLNPLYDKQIIKSYIDAWKIGIWNGASEVHWNNSILNPKYCSKEANRIQKALANK